MNDPVSDISPLELRPTVMDIDLDALGRNFAVLKNKIAPARFMAVMKANAYGHGLVRCAAHLESLGVDYFGVALVEEGIALRKAGIRTPILIFGGIFGGQIARYLDFDLELTASSVDKLKAIDEVARSRGVRAKVHLKFDTGMGRIGVRPERATELIGCAATLPNIVVAGIFSHLASADSTDPKQTREQIALFKRCIAASKQISPTPLAHLANSGGVLQHPDARFDMVRVGIALYGVPPEKHLSTALPLEPVMSISSRVVYFKVVHAGGGVSYGSTWKAPHDSRVVTVPVGYGDGYPRALSNRASVLIRGKRFPVVGNVCMDQIMVNIDRDEAYNGDEVVLLGTQGQERITVSELASLVGTVPHEILTALNLRIPRRYHLGGKVVIEAHHG